jgi:hypothetical protein
MESRPPSNLVVNYVSTSTQMPPLWNTINIMKATSPLRRQYSIETIDPDILSLLASKLDRQLRLDGGERRIYAYSGNSLGQLVGELFDFVLCSCLVYAHKVTDRGPLQEFILFP